MPFSELRHTELEKSENRFASMKLRLTATPQRKDGHHPITIMQCGPIRYRVNAKELSAMYPKRIRGYEAAGYQIQDVID